MWEGLETRLATNQLDTNVLLATPTKVKVKISFYGLRRGR